MRVDRDEVMASLQFSLLVLVLILLPDEELAVFFGLNPQRVWLVVVFIAGLSFFSYLLAKAVDPRTAIGVTGVVGGGCVPGADDHVVCGTNEERRRVRPHLCVRRRDCCDNVISPKFRCLWDREPVARPLVDTPVRCNGWGKRHCDGATVVSSPNP